MFAMIVAFFIWFNSVDTAVTTTTIEQAADTGNNVYQSGAEATYNECFLRRLNKKVALFF